MLEIIRLRNWPALLSDHPGLQQCEEACPSSSDAWQGLGSGWWQLSCFKARAKKELCPEVRSLCDPFVALASDPGRK